MKLKDITTPVLIGVLGFAFISVSLWVWLGRGKNAKAIRAKYKLGGMILSLTAITAVGCRGPMTCYAPPPPPTPPNSIYLEDNNTRTLHQGDTIAFFIEGPTFERYSFAIVDTVHQSLQEDFVQVNEEDNLWYLTVNTPKYEGLVFLYIYGENTTEIQKSEFLEGYKFILHAK